mmetsp:Transcript_23668/g.55709  ORF Transcript_23668/g.55709 Transcript_23668/m.55709 type:complete len:278 (-) Transcript_23668:92-925(-)
MFSHRAASTFTHPAAILIRKIDPSVSKMSRDPFRSRTLGAKRAPSTSFSARSEPCSKPRTTSATVGADDTQQERICNPKKASKKYFLLVPASFWESSPSPASRIPRSTMSFSRAGNRADCKTVRKSTESAMFALGNVMVACAMQVFKRFNTIDGGRLGSLFVVSLAPLARWRYGSNRSKVDTFKLFHRADNPLSENGRIGIGAAVQSSLWGLRLVTTSLAFPSRGKSNFIIVDDSSRWVSAMSSTWVAHSESNRMEAHAASRVAMPFGLVPFTHPLA